MARALSLLTCLFAGGALTACGRTPVPAATRPAHPAPAPHSNAGAPVPPRDLPAEVTSTPAAAPDGGHGLGAPPIEKKWEFSLCAPGCGASPPPSTDVSPSTRVACLAKIWSQSRATCGAGGRASHFRVGCQDVPTEPFLSQQLLPRLGWAKASAAQHKQLASIWLDTNPEVEGRVERKGGLQYMLARKAFHSLEVHSEADGTAVARLWLRMPVPPQRFGERSAPAIPVDRLEFRFAADGTVARVRLDGFAYDEDRLARKAAQLADANYRRIKVEVAELTGGDAEARAEVGRWLPKVTKEAKRCYARLLVDDASPPDRIGVKVELASGRFMFVTTFPVEVMSGCLAKEWELTGGKAEGPDDLAQTQRIETSFRFVTAQAK